jgi:hypothetical protein
MGLNLDQVVAAIKHGDHEWLKPIFQASTERFGVLSVRTAAFLCAGEDGATNPFASGYISAANLPAGTLPTPIWFGMYPRMVTFLIGETGAGKSSLLYNVALHAALDKPLFGFGFHSPTGRPLRVLYIDPENSGQYAGDEITGGLCAVKLDRIGIGRPENLIFHHGQGVDLSKDAHMLTLTDRINDEHFDLVAMEPIANLFTTRDENDNAEAARQAKALITLSRATKACVIAGHHTGRDTTSNYGRGASARLGGADVGMVLRVRGAGDDRDDTYNGETRDRDDICRLQIVKDRPAFFGKTSKYLRMEGQDRFSLAAFEEWLTARPGKSDTEPSRMFQAVEEIQLLLADDKEMPRTQIVDALKKEGIGEKSADAALRHMTATTKEIVQRIGERNKAYYSRDPFADEV